ncbi:hypothetical protein BT96DRAFT_161017 [Gymnopus androsaceus JB14]|uniref:F-box domain-containing protein n=1 Tax=Gymnopus androsaceus JB14 TaxID=1447944 RepID=A0A6A4HAQ4_9AGAR|nr:hypothetical protein BT96DRAFT_161017 [Gymnopus androsaceus JB14]
MASRDSIMASLDELSVHLRSTALPTLETITQESNFINSFGRNALDQLRQCHFPTTPSELAVLDAFSQDARLIQESLEKALAETLRVIRKLTEVDIIRKRVSEYRQGLQSPIRKLPPEVLIEIFEAYIYAAGGPDEERGYGLRIREYTPIMYEAQRSIHITCPSMELSWICAHWRQLALSRSFLWSSLYLNCQGSSALIKICQEYLSRSGNASLKLHIQRLNPNAMLDLLLDHSVRWKEVALSIHSSAFIHATDRLGLQGTIGQSVPDRPFPNLKHLDLSRKPIDGFYANAEDEVIKSRNARLFTSSLKGLGSYVNDTLDWSSLILHDFSQLTSLELYKLEGRCIAPFLARLPTLRSFRLDIFKEIGDESPVVPELCHNLSVLQLTKYSLNPKAWHGLRLPHVTTFEIHDSIYYHKQGRRSRVRVDHISKSSDESEIYSQLLAMSDLLLQSGCILRTLKLHPIMHHSWTVELLKRHSSISDLAIYRESSPLSSYLAGLFDGLKGTLQVSSESMNDYPALAGLRTFTIGKLLRADFPDPADHEWLDKLAQLVECKTAGAVAVTSRGNASDKGKFSRLEEFRFLFSGSLDTAEKSCKSTEVVQNRLTDMGVRCTIINNYY